MWATKPLAWWTAVCPRWGSLLKPRQETRRRARRSSQGRGFDPRAKRKQKPRKFTLLRALHQRLKFQRTEKIMAKVSFSTSGIKSWWESYCGTSSTGCPWPGRSSKMGRSTRISTK
ncbi:uncharacterized protein O9250_006779 [Rhynochetos jubatus]